MNRPVRTVLFWIHLALGVAASTVGLALCLTGAVLALELPVTRWTARVDPSGPPAELLVLAQAAAEQHEGQTPQSLTLSADPAHPVVASWGRRDTLDLDPSTGAALDEAAGGEFFHTVMALHRWFALEGSARDAARWATGGASLLFVLLVPTGLILWWPRKWTRKSAETLFVPKWRRYGKALEFQWHHAFGVWSAVPLLLLALTGAAIGFHWLNDGLVKLAGGEVAAQEGRGGPPQGGPPQGGPPKGDRGGQVAEASTEPSVPLAERLSDASEALALVAQEHPDWRRMTLDLPENATAPLQIEVDRGNGRQLQRQETLTVSRDPLAITARSGWADQDRARRVKVLIRFGHTGEMFGAPGLIVAIAASLAGALLSWTGLALSLRRFGRWWSRLQSSSAR